MKTFIFLPFMLLFLVAGKWAELELQPTEYIVSNLSHSLQQEVHQFSHSLHKAGDTVFTDAGDTLIIIAKLPDSLKCWTCTFDTRIESIPAFRRDTTICNLTEVQIRQFEQDSSETVITRRLSTSGDTMYIAYVTKVECRLKP